MYLLKYARAFIYIRDQYLLQRRAKASHTAPSILSSFYAVYELDSITWGIYNIILESTLRRIERLCDNSVASFQVEVGSRYDKLEPHGYGSVAEQRKSFFELNEREEWEIAEERKDVAYRLEMGLKELVETYVRGMEARQEEGVVNEDWRGQDRDFKVGDDFDV